MPFVPTNQNKPR